MTLAELPMTAAEAAWLRSRHGAVYAVLQASLESPLAAAVPGTSTTIDAALHWFRHAGDGAAVRRLEAIALDVHELQLALRTMSAGTVMACRARLAAATKDWLLASPMLPMEVRRAA